MIEQQPPNTKTSKKLNKPQQVIAEFMENTFENGGNSQMQTRPKNTVFISPTRCQEKNSMEPLKINLHEIDSQSIWVLHFTEYWRKNST